MNTDDVIDLLTIISVSDKRTIGESDVIHWEKLIGQYDKDECLDGIMAHFKERPGVWIEPGYVIERVKARRREILERADPDNRPYMVGLNGVPRDRYGFATKAADDEDRYPPDWTAEQRVSASWDVIYRRRQEAAMIGSLNPKLPASDMVRHEAMEHIRSVLHR